MSVCIGCGLEVDGGTGFLKVKVDPAGGITCGGAGIAATAVPVAAVPVSPDNCNGITRHGNGLYSPCPATIAGMHDDTSGAINQEVFGPNDNYNFEAGTVASITNTLCCPVTGVVTIMAGGLYTQDFAHNFLTIAHLEISVNGGGFGVAYPFASVRYKNNGDGSAGFTDFDNMAFSETITLGSTATITYKPRIQINVQGAASSAGHVLGATNFRTTWHLTQTGCC